MPQSMQDVGTRELHYNELLDLWGKASDILLLISPASRNLLQDNALKDLETASEMLKKHMTITAGEYKESVYIKAINALPKKAEEIKDDDE